MTSVPCAVAVEGIGKRYHIGEARPPYGTMRDALTAAARRLAHIRAWRGSGDQRDTIWALRNVSFDVAPGEVVGIIGRNGAGKSTLLKVLARITEPSEGRAVLRGRVASLLEIGTGFHLELTGRENIFLNGAILGMRRAEILRKFDEIVAFAEVEKFIDTPVKHYSSGMHVRLAFAVAAHLEPEILLVDEVLAVGDAAFQKKCLGKMGAVAREGRTILFVSHNMVAVEQLCQRCVWLAQGAVAMCDRTDDVTHAYLRGVSESDTVREWGEDDAPGCEAVRLRRVAIEPSGDGSGAGFRTDRPLRLTVEYDNRKPGAHLTITVMLLTAEGTVAFNTSTFHSEPAWEGRPFPVGRFRSACTLPPDLLNATTYVARVLVVEDQSRVLFVHDNALTFTVKSAPTPGRAYFGPRPGVVAPRLPWETERLGGPGS